MAWIETWAPYFATSVRRGGREYHEQGRVTLHPPVDGGPLRAWVRGPNKTHQVSIHAGDQDPRAACSCPQFADTERCKHVWATLLAMQASAETLAQHGFAVDQAPPRPPRARKRTAGRAAGREGEPPWAGRLSLMRPSGATRQTPGLSLAQRQVCYVVSQTLSHRQSALVVEVRQRHHTPNGWTRPKPLKIDAVTINGFERTIDRELGAWLLGADSVSVDDLDGNTPSERRQSIFAVRPGSRRPLLRRLLQSGCCYLERQGQPLNIESGALTWDESEHGSAWVLWLSGSSGADGLSVRVELRRGARSMDVQTPDLVLAGADGIVIYGNTAASLDDRGATRWLNQFRTEWAVGATVAPIEVPTGDVPRFLDRLYLLPELPEMDLPAGLGRPQRDVEPSPCMELTMPPAGTEQSSNGAASARVWFDYANNQVKPGEPGRLIAVDGDITLIRRDRTRERAVLDTLAPLGFAANPIDEGESLVLPQRHVSTAVSSLIRDGWVLTANERALRRPGMPSFTIQSNVDWFELRGGILYATDKEDQLVGIPQILAAARAGRHTITLNDGSQGLLPEQWINEHGLLASMGQSHRDHLRFQNTQAALLDALVADAQLIDVDAKFDQIRRGLSGFGRIDPAAETERFQGELRPYQRDGLGWIGFLRDIGMGGILADDMGLGKTVQVLAMLEARYGSRASDDGAPSPEGGAGDDAPLDIPGPTLIVVPRSVVFNWIDEAARFAPNLSVQAYTGQDRQLLRDSFADHDVIVTTYGLLRRDVAVLREHDFDYLVLDEAQAIKNPQSQAAKSARLLNASHRLALTGTPVENHLGDVWSIFEYLNPGMLGSGTKFARLIRGDVAGPSGAAGRQRTLQSVDVAAQAGRALRPFILRRTKRQVLDDLPEKTDQTLLCTMEGEQRKLYDQLLRHYQNALLGKKGAAAGAALGASTFMVLEALLRLRQAACHPGLIDPQHADRPSAKLLTLEEQLTQLVAEGNKSLVFSQFTSMLALVRKRLDECGIVYEYLDGKTRDRKQRIERFQNDPDCPVFLISLKAGGLGLNLTAANYVFILDPWWNPAVEVQAIDRAHRIGQTQHVFAYRLICEDTVEQRIAELQAKKRQLADAIVGGEDNLMRNLTREDLEQLLS